LKKFSPVSFEGMTIAEVLSSDKVSAMVRMLCGKGILTKIYLKVLVMIYDMNNILYKEEFDKEIMQELGYIPISRYSEAEKLFNQKLNIFYVSANILKEDTFFKTLIDRFVSDMSFEANYKYAKEQFTASAPIFLYQNGTVFRDKEIVYVPVVKEVVVYRDRVKKRVVKKSVGAQSDLFGGVL